MDFKDQTVSAVVEGVGMYCILSCFHIPKEKWKIEEEVLLALFYHCC